MKLTYLKYAISLAVVTAALPAFSVEEQIIPLTKIISINKTNKINKGLFSLYSNDKLTIKHPVRKGRMSVLLDARGDLVNGVGPLVKVTVGNSETKEIKVTSTEVRSYVVEFNLEQDAEEIVLEYVNDASDTVKNQDRNLFIMRVKVFLL